MKTIPLTQGKVALVDAEDYERLSQHKWCAMKIRRTFYAGRSVPSTGGEQTTVYMHREIIGKIPEGLFPDHINGDGLDNRRENLRLATSCENKRNSRKRTKTTSRFKGVSWHSAARAWASQIKHIHLGCFATEEDAARAYNKAAREHFGEFAKLNML